MRFILGLEIGGDCYEPPIRIPYSLIPKFEPMSLVILETEVHDKILKELCLDILNQAVRSEYRLQR